MRRIGSVQVDPDALRVELDSHADTVIAGLAFRVENHLNLDVSVFPYTTDYKPKRVPLVNAVTAIDNVDGNVYLLVANQALWLPDVEPSLLSVPQMRAHGVVVDDCPLQYCGRTTHSLYLREDLVQLPLFIKASCHTYRLGNRRMTNLNPLHV